MSRLHVITWKARWRMQNICYRAARIGSVHLSRGGLLGRLLSGKLWMSGHWHR